MKTRAWCFRASYPGKAEFVFGSVVLPYDAMAHEIDAELRAEWSRCFPFDPPANAVAVPGMVWFQPDGE